MADMAPVRSFPAWQCMKIGYRLESPTTEKNWRTCSSVGGWALKSPERIGIWTYCIPDRTTRALSDSLVRKLTIVRYPRSRRYRSPSSLGSPPRAKPGRISANLRMPPASGAIRANDFPVVVASRSSLASETPDASVTAEVAATSTSCRTLGWVTLAHTPAGLQFSGPGRQFDVAADGTRKVHLSRALAFRREET